ncbi:MAG: hypothetical protein QW272_08145 [Candidatus Methanomethylicaceae archaeon]
MKAVLKQKKTRYKYKIIPKIEEIEKLKNSLIGYELYNIKVKFGGRGIKYYNLNDEISYLTYFKYSKENVIVSIRFIKDEGYYYSIKEEEIDFDFIEEENKGGDVNGYR